MEKFGNGIYGKSEKQVLSFEKEVNDPESVSYEFKDVMVIVDSSMLNYTKIPEIRWLVFDDEKQEYFLDQPKTKKEGVDMEYLTTCVKKVVEDSGISEFWIYPYGRDASGDVELRENARLRLLGRYFNISEALDREGYILRLKD